VVEILNPISEDLAVLRSSLLPGLLDSMRRNNAHQVESLRLFEIGNSFISRGHGVQPRETEMIAAILTGNRLPETWSGKAVAADFFDMKGVMEGLFSFLGLEDINVVRAPENEYPYYRKGRAALLSKDGRILGSVGEVDGGVQKCFGLKQEVFAFEIFFDALLEMVPWVISTSPLPKFPSVSRDITIIVDAGVEAGEVQKEIEFFSKTQKLIESAGIFDVYEGKPLDSGKKSLSFRVVYRSWEKTLKEKKVKGIHTRLSNVLLEKFDAGLPA